MINFISGKPGAGKSLLGTRMIIDELRLGKRDVVTNIALDLPRLCEYLHQEYGDSFEAASRIRLLNEEEAGAFYLHRGQGRDVTERKVIEFEGRKIERYNYDPLMGLGGVLFVIDEVDIYYSARGWATAGPDAFYYLKQHRKLGDDVICIAQHISNVDKQFRSVAQDFTYVTNRGKERLPLLFGLVRNVGGFTRTTYPEPVRPGVLGVTGYFTLDAKGIASCYRTSAGVGMIGNMDADKGQRAKGFNPAFLVVPLLVLVMVLWYGPRVLASKMFGADFSKDKGKKENVIVQTNSAPVAAPVSLASLVPGSFAKPVQVARAEPVREDPKTEPKADPIWLSGYTYFPSGLDANRYS